MSETPKISILIPAYNYGRFLEKCLDSVFAQTYRDFEVIVADDGSTDDTEAVALKYPVRYFKLEHRGISPTRNYLLAQAKGEYISFVDADDLWKPEKLERQMAVFEKEPALQAVFCGMENFIDTVYCTNFEKARLEMVEIELYLPSALFRSAVFNIIGQFDTALRIGEDTDFLATFLHKGLKYTLLPEKMYLRRLHDNNISYTRGKTEQKQILSALAANIRRNLHEK